MPYNYLWCWQKNKWVYSMPSNTVIQVSCFLEISQAVHFSICLYFRNRENVWRCCNTFRVRRCQIVFVSLVLKCCVKYTYSSLIVKLHPSPLLEPTSTEQWDWSFCSWKQRYPLMWFELTSANQPPITSQTR